jgi:peptide/nickel transport system substrate-binding protein
MARSSLFKHNMARRDFLKLSATAAGVMVLQSCVGKPTESPAAESDGMKSGGTLTLALPGSPGFLDPALVTTNEGYIISLAGYDGLVRINENMAPEPMLAESWETSDDLLTWTFNLRKGVKYHHGKEFNADDVIYTFERILDPDLGSPAKSILGFVKDLEKKDDYTVVFNLETPSAFLDTSLGAVQNRIVPSDRTTEQLNQELSGTGPFKMEEYAPGAHTTMVANEDYWQEGIPHLDKFRMVYMPEEATQIAALTSGTVDMMWGLGFENTGTVDAAEEADVLEIKSGLFQDVVFDVRQEPFNDVRVVQALKLCVDRPGIRQVVLQGKGSDGNDQPIAPISIYWGDIPVREQNIEKAKELLAEAGYADGLEFTLYTSDSRPGMVELALSFQEMTKAAGVNVQIERVPADIYWGEYWLKVSACVSNWNMRATPDESLSTAYHSEAKWNESFFASDELDKLIDDARGEKDFDKRSEMYKKAQEIISDEAGTLIPYFKPLIMALRKEVKGFLGHPTGLVDVRTVWLDR